MRPATTSLKYFSTIGNTIMANKNRSGNETISLTEATVALDGTPILDSDTYSRSGGVITVAQAGVYLIINHLASDSGLPFGGTTRTSAETFLHINSTLVTGAYTDGYIRRSSGDLAFTSSAFGFYELDVGDTVEMRRLRINGAGDNCRLLGSVGVSETPAADIAKRTSLTLIQMNPKDPMIILEGDSGDTSSLTVNDTNTDQTWSQTTPSRIDTDNYAHTDGTSDITLKEVGSYLVAWSNSWERATDTATRTGVYERIQIDDGAGGSFVNHPGSGDNNYIRGSQSAESILRGNNSECVLVITTVANQKIKLVSAREAGAITCDRLPLKTRIAAIKLENARLFKSSDTTTQNLGSTTSVRLSNDTSDQTSTAFTYDTSGNEATALHNAKILVMANTRSDQTPTVARPAPLQSVRFEATDSLYGTNTSYSRGAAGMQKTAHPQGVVGEMTNGEGITLRSQSLAGNASDLNKTASQSLFVGVDLSTL